MKWCLGGAVVNFYFVVEEIGFLRFRKVFRIRLVSDVLFCWEYIGSCCFEVICRVYL